MEAKVANKQEIILFADSNISSGCDMTAMPEYEMTTEISLQDLGGGQCNLSVYTTAQCLIDIKLGNISKQVAMIALSSK